MLTPPRNAWLPSLLANSGLKYRLLNCGTGPVFAGGPKGTTGCIGVPPAVLGYYCLLCISWLWLVYKRLYWWLMWELGSLICHCDRLNLPKVYSLDDLAVTGEYFIFPFLFFLLNNASVLIISIIASSVFFQSPDYYFIFLFFVWIW